MNAQRKRPTTIRDVRELISAIDAQGDSLAAVAETLRQVAHVDRAAKLAVLHAIACALRLSALAADLEAPAWSRVTS